AAGRAARKVKVEGQLRAVAHWAEHFLMFIHSIFRFRKCARALQNQGEAVPLLFPGSADCRQFRVALAFVAGCDLLYLKLTLSAAARDSRDGNSERVLIRTVQTGRHSILISDDVKY